LRKGNRVGALKEDLSHCEDLLLLFKKGLDKFFRICYNSDKNERRREERWRG
jgi:hypothetical protein